VTRKLAGIGIAIVSVVGALVPVTAQQPPTFRSRTEVVSVDVLVRVKNRPVGGLQSSDFEVKDNGVPQQIDAIRADAVPLDVTLVLDVSGSVSSLIDEFKNNVRQIAKLLRPADRVRLVAFATSIQEIFPFSAPNAKLPLDALQAGGGTALDDALLFALAHAPEAPRRHLVVVFTDGDDNASVITRQALVDAAVRSQGLLHLVLSDAPIVVVPVSGLSVAFSRGGQAMDALRAAAEATGGEVHVSDKSSRLVDGFRAVFETFRAGYVLQYSPRGVPVLGWHEISVNVKKSGAYEVIARRGYVGG
jgi:VWFA-related protein